MWRPMGLKNHWEIQKNKKKQNVETKGGEKTLGNKKKQKKNKMWRPMGVKNHRKNQKKKKKKKRGDQREKKNNRKKKNKKKKKKKNQFTKAP